MTTTINLIDLDNPNETVIFDTPLISHPYEPGHLDTLNRLLNTELGFTEIHDQLERATDPEDPEFISLDEMAIVVDIDKDKELPADYDLTDYMVYAHKVFDAYEDYLKTKNHVEPIIVKIKDLPILTPEYLDKISAEAVKDYAMNMANAGDVLISNTIPVVCYLHIAVTLAEKRPNLAIRIA